MGKQDLTPRLLLKVCFSSVLHHLPPLINNCLNLPIGTQEGSWRLFPIIKKMGHTERPLCPGAPQGSAWYQIETSEVIKMVKCGGQCYWPSWKVRFTAYMGEGWDSYSKLSRQWITWLRAFEREGVDPSWTKPEIRAVPHDRNICFLVKDERVRSSLGMSSKSPLPKMQRDKGGILSP